MSKHDDPAVKAAWDHYLKLYYSPAPEEEKLTAYAAWREAYKQSTWK